MTGMDAALKQEQAAIRPLPGKGGRVREVLSASIYFRELPAASIDLLARIARIERFREGELVQAGTSAQPRFFIVLSGALRLSTPASRDGSSTTFAVVGPGGFFGAGRFLIPDLVWGDCYAVGETELGVVPGNAFRDALRRDRILERHVCTQPIRRFNSLMSLFGDVVRAPLAQRLARRLLTQALTRPVAGLREIEVHISQTMLAEMLGVSRSRVSAELRDLQQRRIVRLAYRRLFILDSAALRRIAGPDVRPY